ncbi:velvet factor-domain-containing protein [Fomitopsis serialis]|uniref:velvet factor-domain-containing protein n=1 Tax=Fomitopsis serialis TaxID=139415 RepID=UPI002008A4F2|nr:velvet factor-domain-containing protein [Neoantrodia serialis]KAH9927228.1 velvet factor-domain-containing protein [Neoantrodia serialis]
MSQKNNARASTSNAQPSRQEDPPQEPPSSWGSWVGVKYYSLDVAQNPLRARMCGFGDKDRRPLAPAAVAKMIVRREDGSALDVDDIDTSFFLVTVDLWSADGKQEMNLVLHPTSADRYVPANTPKPKRRGTNSTAQRSNSGRKSPTSPAPVPPAPAPTQGRYPPQVYPYAAQQPPVSESSSYQSIGTYGAPSDASQTWAYPPPTSMERASQYPPAPVLPSIHSLGRNGSSSNGSAATVGYNSATASGAGAGEGWHLENQGREDAGGMGYRTWPPDASYPPIDNNGVTRPSGAIEPSLRASHASASTSDVRENSCVPLAPTPYAETHFRCRYPQEPYNPIGQPGTAQSLEGSAYASAPYPSQQHQPPPPPSQAHQPPSQYQEAPYAQDPTPPSAMPPLPRHTYTRTLVGPLCANACRLLDEHRTPGIFFLFQDLSIRTEGTFRLRLRLMNVGSPPAPEPGSRFINIGFSKILAQTFTDPFVVYSAKRFPGVPETTALSIALGNQGQKLPLRNRNTSTKQSRKRPRSGSDGSGGEESDDA